MVAVFGSGIRDGKKSGLGILDPGLTYRYQIRNTVFQEVRIIYLQLISWYGISMIVLQVDLETGKRRSWVETEEKEMIDLCGETPGQYPGTPHVLCSVADPDPSFYLDADPDPDPILKLNKVIG